MSRDVAKFVHEVAKTVVAIHVPENLKIFLHTVGRCHLQDVVENTRSRFQYSHNLIPITRTPYPCQD
eukprot:scaffold46464_cov199-Amphora_coffeaeformis.AAC.2